MKLHNLLSLLSLTLYAYADSSQSSKQSHHPASNPQAPMMNVPNVALPPQNNEKSLSPPPQGDLMIADVIGKERIINIFAGFTRDIDSISKRLEEGTQNVTVLAPLNSEIQKLPRKPWEDPKDYDTLGESAYKGAQGEDRAHRNLRHFVEAHVVPASPWEEGEKVETVGGGKVWWESKEGKKIVQPGNIEVSNIASRVSNGELWVLKGILNYAS
ncbi:hypothetical protein MMC06_006103 [Schaereria dolodes]|nr:hypothetical protein [Schaereria dolodes]